jgi:arylsulfatase A-like enzyme
MPTPLLQRRWPWLLAMVLVLALFLSTFVRFGGGDVDSRPLGAAEQIEALKTRKDVNLLFIVIDTLRADRLSGYGYARQTSPVLDLLASRGVRFANQLSQSSWTKCSMASMWTATYPARTRITRFDSVIPSEATMPAEILRQAGFRTTGLWRNGWVAPSFGFGQGFEVYDRPVSVRPPPSLKRENPTVQEGGTDEDGVRAAIEFLRVQGDDRWFLYMHFMDVHEYTYDEDSAKFGTSYSDVYDNAVLRVNLVLNQLLGSLAEMGYLDHTLIAVASDHGEAFGEHGDEGHARNVYHEATYVPFILSFPFKLDPGLVIESRTSNIDVWPTLLGLLGLPPIPDSDGRSLVPEILAAARGETAPADGRPAYAHLDQRWGQRDVEPAPTVAVVDGGFRFVESVTPRGTREELFDTKTDQRERNDLSAEQPEEATRLRDLARGYLESEPAPWANRTGTLELDELELNQLRALGYAVP